MCIGHVERVKGVTWEETKFSVHISRAHFKQTFVSRYPNNGKTNTVHCSTSSTYLANEGPNMWVRLYFGWYNTGNDGQKQKRIKNHRRGRPSFHAINKSEQQELRSPLILHVNRSMPENDSFCFIHSPILWWPLNGSIDFFLNCPP